MFENIDPMTPGEAARDSASLKHPLAVGQRMYYKGHSQSPSGYGLVVKVEKQPQGLPPVKMFRFSGSGLKPLDDSYRYKVVLKDGRTISDVLPDDFGGTPQDRTRKFMLAAGVADQEEVAQSLSNAAMYVASVTAKEAEQKARLEKAMDAASQQGLEMGLVPEAVFRQERKRGSAAAHNLRTELKRFGIKASVTSDGSNAINVKLAADADESLVKQVNEIAAKYERGTFDGMTDCYEHNPSAWGRVFGCCDYVFVSKTIAD